MASRSRSLPGGGGGGLEDQWPLLALHAAPLGEERQPRSFSADTQMGREGGEGGEGAPPSQGEVWKVLPPPSLPGSQQEAG